MKPEINSGSYYWFRQLWLQLSLTKTPLVIMMLKNWRKCHRIVERKHTRRVDDRWKQTALTAEQFMAVNTSKDNTQQTPTKPATIVNNYYAATTTITTIVAFDNQPTFVRLLSGRLVPKCELFRTILQVGCNF